MKHLITIQFIICCLFFCVLPAKADKGNVILPVVFYADETGLGLGAMDILYFKSEGEKHHSSINSVIFGTTKSQFLLVVQPEIQISSLYIADGFILFNDFKKQFYGTGNQSDFDNEENYKNYVYGVGFGLHRKIKDNLKIGVMYNIRNLSVKDKKTGGLMEQYDTEGVISGAGFKASYDTRDNNLYAQSGYRLELSWLLYDSKTGSSFDYCETIMDFRNYFRIGKKTLFSYQVHGRLLNGYPPVQMLSTFGGANQMRGYYSGRYVDNIVIFLQPEIKTDVSESLQIAFFSGIGNVYRDIESIDLRKIKTASGAGLRIKLKDNPRINIRTDFGFSCESAGFYVTMLEAF